ncbi:MAG: OmpA family protein [Bacteroidales bacterium]
MTKPEIYRIIIFALALSTPGFLLAQNLVVNSSFESYKYCPGKIRHERIDEVQAWSQPTDGSPDYFHACSKKGSGAPENKFGNIEAAQGEAYVGMHLFVVKHQFATYKEYIMGHLKEPLKEGARYAVRFDIALAGESQFAIDNIGAFLSPRPIQVNTYGMIFSLESFNLQCHKVKTSRYPRPQVQTPKSEKIANSTSWRTVVDTVEASGDEEFIILGSFFPNKDVNSAQVNPEGEYSSAYYYFDNIDVTQIAPPPEKANPEPGEAAEKEPESIVEVDSTEVGFTFELENIYFEFDKSYLKPDSKEELEELYGFLRRHKELRIEIQGHTDSVGSHRYNKRLSERRAVTVKRYLEQKGISSERLKAKGFGKRNPLRSNRTDDGRAKNRRVMVRILPPQDE